MDIRGLSCKWYRLSRTSVLNRSSRIFFTIQGYLQLTVSGMGKRKNSTYGKKVVPLQKQLKIMKKTIILITTAIVAVFVLTAAMGAGLKNYQCRKCGIVVRAEQAPSSNNCRVDGSHQWQELGAVGMMNYHCMKCRVNVESRYEPSPKSCPSSGDHQWNKLGKVGPINFQCRKCGLTVRTEETPNPIGCPNGGNHQWYKSK